MPDFEHLKENVGKFLDVYKILTPEAKAAFEAQMDKITHKTDAQTRILYHILQSAAKDGLTVEEAIEKMKQTTQDSKTRT